MGGWLTPRPGRFTPGGKKPVPIVQGGWVGHRAGLDGWGKPRPQLGFEPRTVRSVASRYTDWDIPVPEQKQTDQKTVTKLHKFVCSNRKGKIPDWRYSSILPVSNCARSPVYIWRRVTAYIYMCLISALTGGKGATSQPHNPQSLQPCTKGPGTSLPTSQEDASAQNIVSMLAVINGEIHVILANKSQASSAPCTTHSSDVYRSKQNHTHLVCSCR
jgi:hypothetical protein